MGLAVPVTLRPMHEPPLADPLALLDATRARLRRGGDVARAVDVLSDGLFWLRRSLSAARWGELVAVVRAHPVLGLLHEDPFARRAFVKPRGPAGDAVLLDLAYDGVGAAAARGASPLGLALLARDFTTPVMVALRERRDFTAALIDHVAELVAMPSVLVLGCGHLREGRVSRAVRGSQVGLLLAVDADEAALAVVEQAFAPCGVWTWRADVRAVLERGFGPMRFDLITTGGVCETLEDARARALVARLFGILKPGGRLVMGNLAPGVYDIAQLEAVCDWTVVPRDAAAMWALAEGVEEGAAALRRVYTRLSPDIHYLELRRRGAGEAWP